jgi:hypothetical protein
LNEYTDPRGNCAYTNGTVLDRYQYHMDITVSDAAGGGLVAATSIAGTRPPSCPDYIVSGGGADRYGSRVSMIDMFDAVKLYTGSRQIGLDHLQGESLGICAGDGNIWVSSLVNEAADDTMTQIDVAGDIQAQHAIYHADDLAYDGTHVWTLRAGGYTIKKYDLNGNEVESFSNIYPSPHGIAHDGQHLLVFCGSDAIYRLEDDGAMTQLANTPTYQNVSALAYHDGAVWVSEGGNIHRLRTDGTHLGTKVFKGVSINSMDVDADQLFIKIDGREEVFVYPLVDEPFARRKLPVTAVETVAQHADQTFWGYSSGSGSEAQYRVKVVGAPGDEASIITLESDFTPHGLAFDGASLWVNNSYYLTQHRLVDGSRMGSISLPDDPDENNGSKIPCGQITYADGSFWALSSRPSTKRIFQFDLNGALVRQIPAPVDGLSGITFDGQSLWVSHPETNRIYKLATNGDVELSLPSPGSEPSLLYFSEGVLSVVDTETHEAYDWRITSLNL